jgi:hypothetical protein
MSSMLNQPKESRTPRKEHLVLERLRESEFLPYVVLFAITSFVFARTAAFGFVNLDDGHYVYDNPWVRNGLSWSAWPLLTWLWAKATRPFRPTRRRCPSPPRPTRLLGLV